MFTPTESDAHRGFRGIWLVVCSTAAVAALAWSLYTLSVFWFFLLFLPLCAYAVNLWRTSLVAAEFESLNRQLARKMASDWVGMDQHGGAPTRRENTIGDERITEARTATTARPSAPD